MKKQRTKIINTSTDINNRTMPIEVEGSSVETGSSPERSVSCRTFQRNFCGLNIKSDLLECLGGQFWR